MRHKFLLAVVFMLVGVPSAFASHYDLADIDDETFISSDVRDKLTANDIENTEDLLALLRTKKGRAEFSKKYGVSSSDTDFLAHELELMQIRGVGPKAAKLILKAGVTDVKDLSKAMSSELLENLLKTNRELNITGVQPDMTVVTEWIEKAKKVTNHLE